MRTVRRSWGRATAALTRGARQLRGDAGMATAEYAVGTVAAASFAGIVIWILKQDWVRDLISDLFRKALGLG